jgi:hypothetical protein
VHIFRPSLSFLAEAQPRLETGEDKKDARTTKQKTSWEKLQIYFVSNFSNK